MNAKPRPAVELSQYLDQQHRSGTFTHSYFETGFLDHEEPVLKLSNLPEGRSIFDLASLTKALVTTSLFFALLEDGKVSLDAPLRAWGPRDAKLKDALLELSVREILAHTSGLPAWRNFYVNRIRSAAPVSQYAADAATHIETVLARESVAIDGKVDRYSDVGFILLGYLLEKVSQRNLSQMFRDFCLQQQLFGSQREIPLFFTPADAVRPACVPTGRCSLRERALVGEVHDENCAALGGVAGHAGLFGSGEALSVFLKGFFKIAAGRRALDENVRMMTAKADSALCGYRFGNDPVTATFCKGRTFGHYGFTGTAFWIEPHLGKYVIFLTNRVVAGRVNPQFRLVRAKVFGLADEILAGS